MIKSKSKKTVVVSMRGESFGFIKKKNVSNVQKIKMDKYEEKEKMPLQEFSLRKNFLRMKTRLISSYFSIYDYGELFISLIIPREQLPFTSYEEELKIFNEFKKLLVHAFPDCWFFYKVEWSDIAKIHYHLIGTLTHPMERQLFHPEIKREIKRLWEKATGTKSSKSVSIKDNDFHISYLTKKDKESEDCTCLAIVGRKRMWGYINRKSIRFYKKNTFVLTERQFEKFSEYIRRFFVKKTTSKSHEAQLSRPCGRLSFIPREVLLAAYRHAQFDD